MAETHRFRLLLRSSPGDRMVLLVTFGLTMLVDLTVAIAVGMVLASFVFMHRMSKLVAVETGEQLFEADVEDSDRGERPYAPNFDLPEEAAVITFHGPLFFGSAAVLKDALDQVGARKHCYILRLEDVPMIDPTGALALKDFLERALRDGEVIVTGASRTVLRSLLETIGPAPLRKAHFMASFDEAREAARAYCEAAGTKAAA
jgi:SulP family sulfate permease